MDKARKFTELMLNYVIENNWSNLDFDNVTLPEKYAVLIGLSFSVVIKTEYVKSTVPGEICRVPINKNTTKESLISAFLFEMGFKS